MSRPDGVRRRTEVTRHRNDRAAVTATAPALDDHRRTLFTEVEQHADERRGLFRLGEQPALSGSRRGGIVAAHLGDPPIEPGDEVAAEQPVSRQAAGLIHVPRVRSLTDSR